MKVVVCGSRSIESYGLVRSAIEGAPFDVDHIIHGGARGVDNSAKRYAAINGIEATEINPDYGLHGDSAPLKRNTEMVKKGHGLIAVWDGESSGTKHTIEEAKQHGMREMKKIKLHDTTQFVYLAESERVHE